MSMRWQFFVLAAALLQTANLAQAQTEVLDLDAFGQTFAHGLPTRDRSEFLYVLSDPAGGPRTLYSLSIANLGPARPIPTPGISVGLIRLDRFAGRGIVGDYDTSAQFSVDFEGNSPPIPLTADQRSSPLLAPALGHIAIWATGDHNALDPADRDQVYTTSILGGPLVEVTGGIPRHQELNNLEFTGDANTVVVGTASAFDSNVLRTSALYFAKPGVTGMTRVLGSLPGETRFIPVGGDAAGDYYAFEAHRLVKDIWSVSTANPAIATKLNVRPDGSPIYWEFNEIDRERSQMLFEGRESSDAQTPNWVWAAPLDGSADAHTIAKLPSGQDPTTFHLIEGSPWLYLLTNSFGPSGTNKRVYAVPWDGGEAIEFRSPVGSNVTLTRFAPDGSRFIFSDTRTAGNDLYLAQPGNPSENLTTLMDVPDTDRLVGGLISPDGKYAVVTLGKTPPGSTTLADRLLAVPLDGGPVITLDDGTVGPVSAQIAVAGYAPIMAGNRVFYLKAFNNGQVGFYIVDIPQPGLHGDFNDDGLVDAADYVVWRRNVGAPAGTLPNDADGGVIGPPQYSTWRAKFGQNADVPAVAAAVPEPSGFTLVLMLVIASLARRSDS